MGFIIATQYYFRITAVDSALNESDYSNELNIIPFIQSYTIRDKWNLLSVPLTVSDYTKTGLYPTAISSAFAYQTVYVVKDTLENGVGYWLKFNGEQTINVTGFPLTIDSIPVVAGWNMIGSISFPITVVRILSNPPGMITSQFFTYEGSYLASDSIYPGSGYWVKVNQNGSLILSSSNSMSSFGKIRIVPTSELPPHPPDSWQEHLNLPTEFTLEQNYPNPFNPMTVIHYQLPVGRFARLPAGQTESSGQDGVSTHNVSLKVYNVLGQEVAVLVDEMQEAGYKAVEWDASRFPNGVYIYRLTAGSFVDVKKMLIVK